MLMTSWIKQVYTVYTYCIVFCMHLYCGWWYPHSCCWLLTIKPITYPLQRIRGFCTSANYVCLVRWLSKCTVRWALRSTWCMRCGIVSRKYLLWGWLERYRPRSAALDGAVAAIGYWNMGSGPIMGFSAVPSQRFPGKRPSSWIFHHGNSYWSPSANQTIL